MNVAVRPFSNILQRLLTEFVRFRPDDINRHAP